MVHLLRLSVRSEKRHTLPYTKHVFGKKKMLLGAETRWSIEKRNSGANLLCISLGRSSAWNHESRELRRRPRADRCQSGNDRSLANLATRTATTKKLPPLYSARGARETHGGDAVGVQVLLCSKTHTHSAELLCSRRRLVL